MSSVRRPRAAAIVIAFACALAAPALAAPALEALLLDVDGTNVKLSKGSQQGVEVGQIFDLYKDAEVFVLPLTNGSVPLVRSQKRVGRVQVVSVENGSSRARVVAQEKDARGATIRLEVGATRAVYNPTAVAANRPPVFLATPTFPPVPWRGSVEIKLQVSNESDDQVVYTWSASSGSLAETRTLVPTNRWTAPAAAGDSTVKVSCIDSAGNEALTALTLKSSGVEGRPQGRQLPGGFKRGRRFSPAPRYGSIIDIGFDTLGRSFFLDAEGEQVRLELPNRRILKLPVPDREFAAIAVTSPGAKGRPGALFAIDADAKTILRYVFGGVAWPQVLKRKPLSLAHPDGGTGNARFENPADLAISDDEEIYVLDSVQRCVQVFGIRPVPGEDDQGVFLVSLGRPGTGTLELQQPRAIALDRAGHLYVLDNGRKVVVRYDDWRPVLEFSVGGPEEELVGLAVDPYGGDLYVLNRSGGAVKRYKRDGTLIGTFGVSNQPGHAARLSQPTRLRMDPTRVLWVVDRDGAAVARFSHSGEFLGRSGGLELSGPLRVAGSPEGGFAVLDRGTYQVTCFDLRGWITARFGVEGSKPGQFEDPVDLAISASGDIYVLDAEKKSLAKFSPSGNFLDALGRPGAGPRELQGVMDLSAVNDRSYLAVTQQRPDNNFNLFDPGTKRSERTFGKYGGDQTPRFGCLTGITGSLGGRGPESATPWYWTVDDDKEKVYRARPGTPPAEISQEFDEVSDMEPSIVNQVFVVDEGEEQVVVLSPRGVLVTALKGEGLEPWDVGLDDYGRVYVYDSSSKRVVEFVPRD